MNVLRAYQGGGGGGEAGGGKRAPYTPRPADPSTTFQSYNRARFTGEDREAREARVDARPGGPGAGAQHADDSSPYFPDDRGWCTGKVPVSRQETAEFFQDILHRMFATSDQLQHELEKANEFGIARVESRDEALQLLEVRHPL